jgi:hypothetical protein
LPRDDPEFDDEFDPPIVCITVGTLLFILTDATSVTAESDLWQLAAPSSVRVVAALAGHKSVNVTANKYSDPQMDRKRVAVEKGGKAE